MKAAGVILVLILGLCVAALGQNEGTVGDLHTGCHSENLAKRAYAVGFVSGVALTANYMSKGTLEKQPLWPKTKGQIVDAVCKYIDLHPEKWAEEASLGVLEAVNDLYLPSSAREQKRQ